MKGSRQVIPTSLSERVLSIAHTGHQGIVKTKQLLRTKVWWPGIDNDVETLVKSCILCQATIRAINPDPLRMTSLPERPWESLYMDFCGPFPTGESALVVIDSYSRFPEVELMKTTTATATIKRLERIFATHGLPEKVTSDNGPPFQSAEFKAYMENNGILHHKITPLWPLANGEAEAFMKPLQKAVQAAHAEGRDWHVALNHFLLNYRATPHTTTNKAPAELLFNRSIRTKLPEVPISNGKHQAKFQHLRTTDSLKKDKMKKYADKKRNAQFSTIRPGDQVIVLQQKKNKFSTKYETELLKVVKKKGSMITARRHGGSTVTGNVSHLKLIPRGEKGSERKQKDQQGELQIQARPRRNRKPPDYYR